MSVRVSLRSQVSGGTGRVVAVKIIVYFVNSLKHDPFVDWTRRFFIFDRENNTKYTYYIAFELLKLFAFEFNCK